MTNQNNTKEMWDVIHELLGKQKHKNLKIPNQIKPKSESCTEFITQPQDIIEQFNDFFIQIGESLAKKIDNSRGTNYMIVIFE